MTTFVTGAINRMSGNKHTTAAGVIYVAAKFGCPILSAWFPEHKAQLETTAGYLEGAAVFYGFASAGDGDRGGGNGVDKGGGDGTTTQVIRSTLIIFAIATLGMFLLGCANLATNMFRSEQAAVNLATTTYIGYTNGLYSGAIHVTPDQSNNIKGLRLKFAASAKAAEGWRSAFETNSALQGQAQAAVNALLTDSDNLVKAINQLEAK